MTKTIHAALSPLLIIGSLCGLGFIEYPLGQLRPYVTCLYFLITWSLFAYLFYYLVYTSDTSILFLSTSYIMIIITGITTMFVNLFHFKELKMCLHKLSSVDDTLEVLGIPKEYQRLYKWIIRMIITWIIVTLLLNLHDSFSLTLFEFDSSIAGICVPFVGNYLLHINTLNALIWGTILRHIHLQLCIISRELNKVFSIQMTLQMGCYFLLFIDQYLELYAIYMISHDDDVLFSFKEEIDSKLVYIWVFIFSTKIFMLNYICQFVCDEASKTLTIIYKLSNDNPNKDFREQAVQFVLQIKQREVKFSGMGFFYFGYNFIRKFYLSVVTVVVIITQLNTDRTIKFLGEDDEDYEDDEDD